MPTIDRRIMLSRTLLAVAPLAALFLLASCRADSPPATKAVTAAVVSPVSSSKQSSGAVLATFSGQEFRESDFRDLVSHLNPRSRKTLENPDRRRSLIENHILSQLIFDRGKREGLLEDPEVKQKLADLERQIVVQKVMQSYQSAAVPDSEVRKYYDDHIDAFSTDRVEASHILVADEELAKSIRAELAADPSKFAELAAKHSTDRSNAEKGGELGFFGKGRMVKEFEDAAFALSEDGQISDPVKTRFGYHIIKRISREDGKIRPFEEVENQIRVKLVNEARTKKTEAFLAELRKEANLSINEDAIAALELPSRRDDAGK